MQNKRVTITYMLLMLLFGVAALLDDKSHIGGIALWKWLIVYYLFADVKGCVEELRNKEPKDAH